MVIKMSNEITISKNLLIGVAIIIIIGIAGLYLFQGKQTQQNSATTIQNTKGEVQEVYLTALSNGDYDKSEIRVRKGVPVRLHFRTQGNVGCGMQLVIRGMGVNVIANGNEAIAEFTPQNEGTYTYTCGMGMWGPGRLIVS